MRVAIVDYGSGNLASVAGALSAIGADPLVTGDAAAIEAADRVILPGVGAFGDCMQKLQQSGLIPLLEALRSKTPILGICVGAQMMCRSSDEFGQHPGLGWIEGEVRRLQPADPNLRLPHVGWDELVPVRPSPIFAGIPAEALFYYTHSYGMQADGAELATGLCDYGGSFMAAFARGKLFGVQFHPEKSQRHGLAVLRNFALSNLAEV